MPTTLKETYSQIWDEIKCEEPDMQKVAERALMWVMCSVEPLSKSLWVQLSYRSTTVELHYFDHLVDLCRNLVVWDKQLNKPIFSHLSVQEFLEDNIFTELEAHAMAAYTCISYLSTKESQKSWSGIYYEDAKSSEDKERNVYVRSFWPDHVDGSFNEANPIDPSLLRLLNHFLSPGSDYETRSYPRSGDRFPYRHENEERSHNSLRLELLEDIQDPLFVMSFFQFGEEMESLWKTKAFDVNMRNSNSTYLLEGVCTRRSRWILDFLLQRGADFNFLQETKWGQFESYEHSSLYLAVEHTQPEAIIKLLEKGATPPVGALPVLNVRVFSVAGINILQDLVASSGNDLGCLKRVLSWNRSLFLRNEQITRCRKRDDKINDKEQGRHLLNICGYFRMTKDVLLAALEAENARDILELLFSRYPRLKINARLLILNLRERTSIKTIQHLFDRDASLKVTEAVLEAAANQEQGLEILQLLINRDAGLKVTEAVLAAAAAKKLQGHETIQFLIHRDAGLEVTEAVLVAAAGDENGRRQLELLLNHDPTVQATESMLAAAAANEFGSLEILNLLFDRDSNLNVTEPVMVAAASNPQRSIDVFMCFFRRNPSLKVTEPTLLAVASNEDGDDTMEFLFNYGAVLEVSKATILVAAEVWSGYHTLPMFMLLQHCEDLEFTDSELKMLKSSPYKETIEEFLEAWEEDGRNLAC
jgi:hypothetical protein